MYNTSIKINDSLKICGQHSVNTHVLAFLTASLDSISIHPRKISKTSSVLPGCRKNDKFNTKIDSINNACSKQYTHNMQFTSNYDTFLGALTVTGDGPSRTGSRFIKQGWRELMTCQSLEYNKCFRACKK